MVKLAVALLSVITFGTVGAGNGVSRDMIELTLSSLQSFALVAHVARNMLVWMPIVTISLLHVGAVSALVTAEVRGGMPVVTATTFVDIFAPRSILARHLAFGMKEFALPPFNVLAVLALLAWHFILRVVIFAFFLLHVLAPGALLTALCVFPSKEIVDFASLNELSA